VLPYVARLYKRRAQLGGATGSTAGLVTIVTINKVVGRGAVNVLDITIKCPSNRFPQQRYLKQTSPETCARVRMGRGLQ